MVLTVALLSQTKIFAKVTFRCCRREAVSMISFVNYILISLSVEAVSTLLTKTYSILIVTHWMV